jgi:aminopeptidase N
LFDLKVPIGFGYLGDEAEGRRQEAEGKNGSKLKTQNSKLKTFSVRIHEREQAFYFPLEKKPDFVSFDVGNHTLKTVVLEYPLPELKVQLKADPDPLSRIVAAEMLAKKGGLEAVNALNDAFKQSHFGGCALKLPKTLQRLS